MYSLDPVLLLLLAVSLTGFLVASVLLWSHKCKS